MRESRGGVAAVPAFTGGHSVEQAAREVHGVDSEAEQRDDPGDEDRGEQDAEGERGRGAHGPATLTDDRRH